MLKPRHDPVHARGDRPILPPREHRTVSLLPPSHLFEQAPVLFFGTMIGAHILYVRSRTPRVIFEALREERVTTMVVVPQLLELFWLGLEREVKRQGKERAVQPRRARIARLSALLGAPADVPVGPRPARRRAAPDGFRRRLPAAGASAGHGRISASSSCRATARPSADRLRQRACGDHPTATVGKTTAPVQVRLAAGRRTRS